MNDSAQHLPAPLLPVSDPPLEATDYRQFLLHGRNEVLFVLRELCSAGDRISLYFNDGRDCLPTQILAVEDDVIVLDRSGDPATNQRALVADRLFAVTRHNNVRVQFALPRLLETQYLDVAAFRAALPESVLRLQRREFYRLALPVAESLKCRIPIDDGKDAFTANIIDISGGGLAVVVPPQGVLLSEGMEFPNCRIDLPEVGMLAARLELRTLFELTLPSGVQVHRAGCQFVDLPGSMLTLVQRYVIKIERQRKARTTGLA
jgi:c-di-GMP-binding flagellar brake protein YcgR